MIIGNSKGNGGFKSPLNPDDIPPVHRELLLNSKIKHIDDKNRLFVHAGFNRHIPIDQQPDYVLLWDRDLWGSAMSYQDVGYPFKIKDDFSEIFIGHTTTNMWKNPDGSRITVPMQAANITNLDTGSGGRVGKLTFMDIDTREIWQSDPSGDLYPEDKGRW